MILYAICAVVPRTTGTTALRTTTLTEEQYSDRVYDFAKSLAKLCGRSTVIPDTIDVWYDKNHQPDVVSQSIVYAYDKGEYSREYWEAYFHSLRIEWKQRSLTVAIRDGKPVCIK